jgi:O-antigen/teichoic acid export membrane protein
VDRSNPPAGAPSGKPAVPKQTHSLTLSSSVVFGASVATQLLGFIATIYLSHQIGINTTGKTLLGTVQLFLLIGSVINGVGDLRLGTAYTFFLARGKPPPEITAAYLYVRMLMVGLAGLVIFVVAPLSVGGHQLASGTTQLESLGIFAALPLLWSFSTVYNAMLIGLGNSAKAQYPSLVEALVRLPILVYVSYYDQTIEGITIAYAVGALASTLYCLPTILRNRGRFHRLEIDRMFRFAWPLMGSLVLGYLVTNLIPFFVAGSPGLGAAQLNIFLVANGWRILVLSLPAAVATPLFPYLAGLHRQEEYEGIRRGTWQALRYSAMLLVPGVVALVTYRNVILNVFAGSTYASSGAIPLAILVVGAIPLALSQIMQTSINAIGRQRLELYITSAQVVVLFGGVLLLMPPWGILPASQGLIAASIAVLASSVTALGLNTYFMETLIRVHLEPRSVLGITLSAAGGFWTISLFNRYLPHNRYYLLLAGILLSFLVYFLVLVLIGELTREDIRQLGASVGLPARVYNFIARVCWRDRAPGILPVDLTRAAGLRPTELPETFTGTTELPAIVPLSPETSPEEPPDRPG